eukprot:TRINITY_DN12622_c0_g2_i2.p1 TRINITY_DN12622_c0_g2~~TRINITY_DN12622_c0_g2_i2.p1  ORF type:complete len:426 (+),score=176.66 TRINITY_DN12622_c0_g2_i2:51-1328(+)
MKGHRLAVRLASAGRPQRRCATDLGEAPDGQVWNIDFTGHNSLTDEMEFKKSAAHPEPLYRVLDTKGNVVTTESVPDLDEETCRHMNTTMLRQSVMDGILYEAQRQGRLSFYMTNYGEEGVQVGSAAALKPQDMIYAQYREAGVLLYRGYEINKMIAQCMGTVEDDAKGRQMPIHYGSPELNYQTISSPLGTQLPQAAGAGYAMRIDNEDRVCICYFGDGAASEGDFHAALNFAATLKCRTIFFCRNNGYAISTPAEDQYAGDGIFARGVGYGIRSVRVDGNDPLAVYAATKKAREMSIEHDAPVLIEAMTYRGGHHSTSDDSTRYRAKSEVDQWMAGPNPIKRFTRFLEAKGWWSEEDSKKVREETRKEVMKSLTHQGNLGMWGIEHMITDVYAEPSDNLKDQLQELKDHLARHPDKYPDARSA